MPKRMKKQKLARKRKAKPLAKKLTYAEAMKAMKIIRPSTVVLPDLSITHPPYPDLPISSITQVKLIAVTHLMIIIGRSPGDYSIEKFDKSIDFRKLSDQSLAWLETCGIPARRAYAPFAAQNYIWLFGGEGRKPVTEENIERFFSRLIHCLLTETQILLTKQYFSGLGLYHTSGNLSRLDEALSLSELSKAVPRKEEYETTFDNFNTIALDELHGKIYLEYLAIMVRAQWDKLLRLSCLVFGIPSNWGSVSEGLAALKQKAMNNTTDLTPWCRSHLEILAQIAEDRLSEKGWIKKFRDPLLHDVGQHSVGVIPHKSSIETTSEMWQKVCDEHDWFREAFMAALVAFMGTKMSIPSNPDRELSYGIAVVKPPMTEKDINE